MEYLSAEYYHVSFWPNESVEVVHWFIVVAVFEAATTAEGVNLISPDQDVCCVHPRFIQAHHRTGKAWKQRWPCCVLPRLLLSDRPCMVSVTIGFRFAVYGLMQA